jgi:hypothetical protein
MPEVSFDQAKELKERTAREGMAVATVVKNANQRVKDHEARIKTRPRKAPEAGELSGERLAELGANPPGPPPEAPPQGPDNDTLLLAANKLEHEAVKRDWRSKNDQALGTDDRVGYRRQAQIMREAAAIVRGLMAAEPPEE